MMVFTHKIVCRKSPKLYASYHNQTPQKTCFNLTEKAAFNLPNNSQLLSQIAARLFPEFSEEEQLSIIDGCCEAEHQALEHQKAPVYPGLEETLSVLSKKYPLFIVSNCQAGYIEVFLKATGFGHYFSGHLCPGDTGMEKGDNIKKIIHDYKLTSPVYVGDTAGDYNACRQAGIPFVFASYGFGHVENPDYTISELKDLISLF